MFRHLANTLSLARIPASLGVLAVYDPQSPIRLWTAAGLVIVIMGSDFFDGKIARKYHLVSKLGYVLDGLGDRACHVTAYLLLLKTGILNILVVWILIFREISQYAVRLVDTKWHSAQSRVDRAVTKAYTTIVQVLLLLELLRALFQTPVIFPQSYVLAANVLLFAAVLASYARIIPQLAHAWHEATHA
jgi:phosphatidylglycerophosphate synthase